MKRLSVRVIAGSLRRCDACLDRGDRLHASCETVLGLLEKMREWPVRSFVGGNTVLDFVNTAGGDTKARDDVERLNSYEDVLSWSLAADVINASEYEALATLAAASPRRATKCLHDLRGQRESLFNYISASISDTPVPESDRLTIERNVRSAFTHARLVADHPTLSKWRVDPDKAGLSLVQFRLDLAASTVITGLVSADIRQCELCSWFFMDSSKSKRRRWCSMAICGNRAKVQRHYYRSRETTT